MDVKASEPVTLVEVAALLKKKEKEYADYTGELRYEQKRALEHAKTFKKISTKDVKSMVKQLSELEINLNAERIVKIIDLMPSSVDDIRAIFAKERFKYTEEELKKITDVVDQYR